MGKLLLLGKYIFLIFSSDFFENRKHIHVTFSHKGFKKSCKFWLEPKIELDENKKGDFSNKELKEIEKLIIKYKKQLLEQLEKFYNGKKIKSIKI